MRALTCTGLGIGGDVVDGLLAVLHPCLVLGQRDHAVGNGKLVEEKGASLDAMNLALEEITNWLAGRFTENPAFSAEFPDRERIILRPREKGLAAIISSIELHLSGSEGLLDSVIINEGQDAYTKTTFSDAVLNPQLDEHLFTRP